MRTTTINTLRLKQNGCHFADIIFKCVFLHEKVCISIGISLKFLRVQLTISQHWFRWWLGADQAAITWTNVDLNIWLLFHPSSYLFGHLPDTINKLQEHRRSVSIGMFVLSMANSLGNKTHNKSIPAKQGKSEGFDSCDRPSYLTQTGFKSLIFQPVWPWYLMDDQKKH